MGMDGLDQGDGVQFGRGTAVWVEVDFARGGKRRHLGSDGFLWGNERFPKDS